jgi:hypothetical protein
MTVVMGSAEQPSGRMFTTLESVYCIFLAPAVIFRPPYLLIIPSIFPFCATTISIPVFRSMNMTQKLEATNAKDNGYTVVPLKEVVAYFFGQRTSLPAKAVVITADDGW